MLPLVGPRQYKYLPANGDLGKQPFHLPRFYSVHCTPMKNNGLGDSNEGIPVFCSHKIRDFAPYLVKNNVIGWRGQRLNLVAAYVWPAGSETTHVLLEKLVSRCNLILPLFTASDFNARFVQLHSSYITAMLLH